MNIPQFAGLTVSVSATFFLCLTTVRVPVFSIQPAKYPTPCFWVHSGRWLLLLCSTKPPEMKKVFYTLLACTMTAFSFAQDIDIPKVEDQYKQRFGLKAGYNWSYVTGSEEGFKPGNRSGFMVSAFYAPTSRTGKGFRSEIVFSRQGYSFDNGGKNTDVLNDYVYLPQLVTFGIGRFFQLQAGAQIGVLLNSKMSGAKDSTITGLMNRIDYGFAAGVELNPAAGFLIGGRYNLGLGKLYKRYETTTSNPGPYPLPFNPETTNMKNGVVQLFVGYRF